VSIFVRHLGVLLALAAVPPSSPATEPARPPRFFEAERPLVIAHRGGMALGPEHTLETFRRAVALGVDALELDVRETRDGALVAVHDSTVDRTTDGSGPVAGSTLAELRVLDAGHRWSPDGGRTFPFRSRGLAVPTLDEILVTFPETPLVIELKSPSETAAETLCATLRARTAASRVLVAAFRAGTLASFRRACPEVSTAATAREVRRVWLLQRLFLPPLYCPPADAFFVPQRFWGFRIVDEAFVERAERLAMSVHVWTVDDPADVRRLSDLGVHGFVTDDPERVLGALGRLHRGAPVASGSAPGISSGESPPGGGDP
jgi:glycerophosphoryl diester phosphodiesterase